jgi:hypothetical protein
MGKFLILQQLSEANGTSRGEAQATHGATATRGALFQTQGQVE